jgi:hypothetical protein
MMPLMPSPGRPKTTFTSQAIKVSMRTSAVLAISGRHFVAEVWHHMFLGTTVGGMVLLLLVLMALPS